MTISDTYLALTDRRYELGCKRCAALFVLGTNTVEGALLHHPRNHTGSSADAGGWRQSQQRLNRGRAQPVRGNFFC
jgi:hypothetical protein